MRILGLTLMIGSLVFAVAGWWLVVRPLPELDGLVTVSQLAKPVVIRFDGRAVPYIEASGKDDLYLAQGYITACDRIFQMDMLRRTAEGKLSEVFGSATLAQDKLMRTVGIARTAQQELALMSTDTKAALSRYALGVNLYLIDHLHRLPIEFQLLAYRPQPWQPVDTLAIMKYLAYVDEESWQLDDLRQRILTSCGPEVFFKLFESGQPAPQKTYALGIPANLSTTLPVQRASTLTGSTGWVVSGSLSDSGGALLACDKHQRFTYPDLWYLTHLSCPGLRVAGATVPGVPGILIGRNENISWSWVHQPQDVQDLVLERMNPKFPNRYRTARGWSIAAERQEIIPVRFSTDLVHKVISTSNGPLLAKEGSRAAALAWTGSTPRLPALESFLTLNRTDSLEGVSAHLKRYSGQVAVFLMADCKGNCALTGAGLIPGRESTGDGQLPIPGWVAGKTWAGTVEPGPAFKLVDPTTGFGVYANEKPKGQVGRAGSWAPPYRAERVRSFLSRLARSKAQAGLPDMNELQSDQAAALANLISREISLAAQTTELIGAVQLKAAKILSAWHGQLRPDSQAAAIYACFLHTLARRLLEPKLGVELTSEYMERWQAWPLIIERFLKHHGKEWLPPEERTYRGCLLTTFAESLKSLGLAFGADDPDRWPWGETHQAVFTHKLTELAPWAGRLLNPPPQMVGGDGYSVNTAEVEPGFNRGRFHARAGSTTRLLIDMGDSSKFYAGLSLGQSGQLFSPFARNQLRSWVEVAPYPVAFSAEEIERQTEHKLFLRNSK